MDERDIAMVGINALAGASTAMGPAGAPLALLGLSVAGVMSLYGGASNNEAPSLTDADIAHLEDTIRVIITETALKQDARDAWAQMSPTYNWYKKWTIRAKGNEKFTAADLDLFDRDYDSSMGPNSMFRAGLTKLYPGTSNIDTTPGQYGVPYLVMGVGLLVQLLEIGIARTVARGEEVSSGEWQNLLDDLRYWEAGLQACDRLAHYRVEEEIRNWMEKDKSVTPGSTKLRALLRELEIIYHGGAQTDGDLPVVAATKAIVAIELRLEATRKV